MLNNTLHAEQELLIFNRLEKVGSLSFARFLRALGPINNFAAFKNAPIHTKPMLLSTEAQHDFAEAISEIRGAKSYYQHMNYLNFTQFGFPRPIYINLVRHPLQRAISAYYFVRQPYISAHMAARAPDRPTRAKKYIEMPFNECVRQEIYPDCVFGSNVTYNRDWRRFSMRFCGNYQICTEFNSPTATQIAKKNIESEYAVVGSWEDTNITLTVLEHYIPRFFRNAMRIYYAFPEKFHINKNSYKSELDPDVESKLNMQFAFEIELYNFCKQRLYKQYIAIKQAEFRH